MIISMIVPYQRYTRDLIAMSADRREVTTMIISMIVPYQRYTRDLNAVSADVRS